MEELEAGRCGGKLDMRLRWDEKKANQLESFSPGPGFSHFP